MTRGIRQPRAEKALLWAYAAVVYLFLYAPVLTVTALVASGLPAAS